MVIHLPSTGAESGEQRAAQADTLSPAYPGLQRERQTRSLGGGKLHPPEKHGPTSQPRTAPGERGSDAAPHQETAGGGGGEGEGRWEGISATAFPSPEEPRLFQGKVYLGGGGRERKGRDYSHGLQGFAEPGFQRLEVFYDHFNHHPERPGPPASPAAPPPPPPPTAAGSSPPRRPGPRLPPRLPSPAEAASRFGRGRLAGAGGPAPTKGAEPAERRRLLLPAGPALAAPLAGERGLAAPQFPSPLRLSGGRRAVRPTSPANGGPRNAPGTPRFPRPHPSSASSLPLAAEPDGVRERAR